MKTVSSRASRRTIMAAALAAGALALTACGTSSGAESTGAPGASGSAGPSSSSLKVGATSSLSGLGLRVAIADGEFKKRGLTVTPVQNQTANAAIPALLNGQIQLGQVDTLTLLQAAAQGVPVQIVAGASEQASDGEAGTMTQASIVVKAGSAIKSAVDLVGKKVAVPAIKTQTWMNIRAVVDAAGGDSSKVQFVEVPPDQMLDLLLKGTVDAADISEPLASSAIASGQVRLLHNADAPGDKGAPASMYVATKTYLAKNASTAAEFAQAVEAAAETTANDRPHALKIAQQDLGYKPDQLAHAVIPTFSTEPLTVEEVQKVADLAVKYGVLSKVPDLTGLLAK